MQGKSLQKLIWSDAMSVLPFFLDVFYFMAAVALSPLLLYRMLFRGKYWGSLRERLGDVTHLPVGERCIWLHGVSVGEIKAARALVTKLKVALPDTEIVISATSSAGKKVAATLYPECQVIPFPLDFSRAVVRYLDHFCPRLIILMELELWPNFLWWANKKKIPVVLVNGRLSERSFKGYRRFLRPLFPKMTTGICRFAMQSEVYAKRLRELGVPKDRIVVTGNMKFDTTPPQLEKQAAISQTLLAVPHLKIWIAGSTHSPEEKIVLSCYTRLKASFPELRLIVVPRHPERGSEIIALVRAGGFVPVRRSEMAAALDVFSSDHVVIGDRMGELGELYPVSHIAFVGGSLIAHGGQNFIEPASLGKAVICGPFMGNFPEVKLFVEQKALLQIASPDQLYETVLRLLQDPTEAQALGKRAQELVAQSRGSSERNCELCLATVAR